MKNTFNTSEAATMLGVSVSRIEQHCRAGRLGQSYGKVTTTEKDRGAWVITRAEIKRFREIGKLPAGRPKKGTQ